LEDYLENYFVKNGKKLNLKDWPTLIDPLYKNKMDYQKLLKEQIIKMSKAQDLHYATNRNALLIIFQGMDAAGKDSTIKHVMSGINPQGCQVMSFKHPTATELEHDFLWRTTRVLPERGQIGIFNRSYYEEVLITRVHPEILKGESLKNDIHKIKNIWLDRYLSINNLEKHLHQNGTRVIKFFLHLSYNEQKVRFLERIDNLRKNWKFNVDDLNEREHWDDYKKAYEKCLSATSNRNSPWYIIPADDKFNTRLIVAKIILQTFKSFKMQYPKSDKGRLLELKELRRRLSQES